MGLKDLKLPTADVEVPGGGSFAVRGLSLVDMRALFVKYSAEVVSFFDLLTKGGKDTSIDPDEAAATVGHFINQAPAVAAEVIAIATGEDDVFEVALTLPFPVQVDAIKKIFTLTFGTEGAAKKFLQTVSSLTGSTRVENPKR